jgi:hypothetical protein
MHPGELLREERPARTHSAVYHRKLASRIASTRTEAGFWGA